MTCEKIPGFSATSHDLILDEAGCVCHSVTANTSVAIATQSKSPMLVSLFGSLRGLNITDVRPSHLIRSRSDVVRRVEQSFEATMSLRCGEIVC